MSLYYLFIIALTQGITEFLPISSSGHLVLLPKVLEVADQGLMIDIAVHFGTLLAVMLYFHKDILSLAKGGFDTIFFKQTQDRKLFLYICAATLPIIFIGFVMHNYIPSGIRAIEVIGWTTLIFGLLLGWSDQKFEDKKTCDDLSLKNVIFIGFMQVLALIPGTSRSGITMTASRILGLSRYEASRFALLLSIPTILGASVLGIYDLYKSGDLNIQTDALIVVGLSFVAAYLSILGLMRFTKSFTFMPFVYYRIVLGLGILASVYIL